MEFYTTSTERTYCTSVPAERTCRLFRSGGHRCQDVPGHLSPHYCECGHTWEVAGA